MKKRFEKWLRELSAFRLLLLIMCGGVMLMGGYMLWHGLTRPCAPVAVLGAADLLGGLAFLRAAWELEE